MARTSRKPGRAIAKSPAQSVRAAEKAALYARLSVEDTRQRESGSLENQIALLKEYAVKQPGMEIYEIYADHGESGTTFHRPAFQRMLEDIRAGRITCVIVKDLSRFARSYIGAGDYLEQIFPLLGVRFIAVNDGYDSMAQGSDGTSLTVPLKNIVNEAYARDVSRKITSQFAIKQQRGEFLGAFPPYGYCKSPADRHRLEPEPMAAAVVRQIFQWKADGMGNTAIAAALNAKEIPPPGKYRKLQGIVSTSRYDTGVWHKSAVARILINPVYLGDMAQGKEKTSVFLGQGRYRRSPEDWVVVQGTHEALISRELFAKVNETSV